MTNRKQNKACPHWRRRIAVSCAFSSYTSPPENFSSRHKQLSATLPDSKTRKISMQLLAQGSSIHFQSAISVSSGEIRRSYLKWQLKYATCHLE
jgi:hypothetical protein